MTNAILRGKPDAGNPHVRFDEGEVASAKPRRGSLLYTDKTSYLTGRTILLGAAGLLLGALRAGAADGTAELVWQKADGAAETNRVALADAGDRWVLSLSAAEIRAKGATGLCVTPDFARARKGEAGYWFSSYGRYGEFDRDAGVYATDGIRMPLPMFGWSTPRGAYLAVITSLAHYPGLRVTAADGRYALSCTLDAELCRAPYEDLSIAYWKFPAGSDYATLAKRYRRHQLDRKAVTPLAERVKTNPVLRQAVEAPEIRIRQAWKPVPSPMPFQQPEDEPPLTVRVTFERVKDIVRELKRQGVTNAELCLVGWNVGGHDGRWPQSFPSEPLLGGDAKLREAVAEARAAGYLIVPHGNFLDGYRIADCWDVEWTVKNADGTPKEVPGMDWGGGRPYRICPQRAYERFATKDMDRMAALGFRGMGYFDVVSILPAPNCRDPRHPLTFKEGARYWGLCAEEAKRAFGGFASEGCADHFAASLDSVLYASFDDPMKIADEWRAGKGLVKRLVPIFQIVYNGFIVSNPFSSTVNFTVQPPCWRLKLLEYGGRPNFYFYSKFLSNGNDWMGKGDLGCATDDELRRSVAAIKEGADLYARLVRLQYLFIDGHRELAEGVYATRWSDGTEIVVNYADRPYALPDGSAVAPLGWRLRGE